MNIPYVVTPPALEDMRGILSYLHDSAGLAVALRVHEQLVRGFERIASRPHLVGHIRRDLPNEKMRAMRVYSYLVFYLPDTDPVEILRVIHGARDVSVAFQERK
jgi:plasmid stabilization system protein ParE